MPMMSIRHRPRGLHKLYSILFSTGVLSTLSAGLYGEGISSEACFEQAQRPMELSYCEIRKAGGAKNLHSIEDFKKNPENIQRLLLKRDAQRLGINLPSNTPVKKPVESAPPLTEKVQPSLEGCKLIQARIECDTKQYALIGNLKNNQLKAEAFSSHNQLLLPRKESTIYSDQSDYRYLSHIYPIYIYKMLDLGLGDSTMSFTKFAAVFWQNKMEGLDFVERFQFMYNKLKIEKSRNQVQSRYRENFPHNIHQCMRLDARVIVCDDMKQNWVYRRR